MPIRPGDVWSVVFNFTSCHGFIIYYVLHCLLNQLLPQFTSASMIGTKNARHEDHREAVCHFAKPDSVALLTGWMPLPTRHIPSD
jgi:hypothetical protein